MKKYLFLGGLLVIFTACATPLPTEHRSSAPSAEVPSDAVRITWMGTAGCYITDGETAFYIDPFVSRYGLLKVALGFGLDPRRDLVAEWCRKMDPEKMARAVIVTHSHYDHVLDAPFFSLESNALLVGSESTAWVGRGAGMAEKDIRIVQYGDSLQLGRFDIRFLESRHGKALFGRVPWPGRMEAPIVPPASASDYRLGEIFAVVVRHPKGTLVHLGSAAYLPGMFRELSADVVLLGIAGRKDTKDLVDNVIHPLNAPTVIPLHYDDFFSSLDASPGSLWGVDLSEFKSSMETYGNASHIRWLTLGEAAVLFP